jgi:hypothetical protein
VSWEPRFSEDAYTGGILEGIEQLAWGGGQTWQEKIWSDIAEGLEHKPAQMEAWMGDNNDLVAEDDVSQVKDVQIERARGVAWAFGGAAELGFEHLELIQQIHREPFVIDFHHGIQVPGGVRIGIDGIGFVDF